MKYHKYEWQGAVVGDPTTHPGQGKIEDNRGCLIQIIEENEDPATLYDWQTGRWKLTDTDYKFPSWLKT